MKKDYGRAGNPSSTPSGERGLCRALFHHFERLSVEYEARFERENGYSRPVVPEVVEIALDHIPEDGPQEALRLLEAALVSCRESVEVLK